MDLLLNQSLLNFKRELKAAVAILNSKPVPQELDRLKQWLSDTYKGIETDLDQLDYLISLQDSDLHEDLLSGFSSLQYWFRFYSTKYLPAIYRNHDNDLLALRLLKWLHGEHPQTKDEPFLIQDGNFSILPAVSLPISYYLPVIYQQGLLFLPLFFHELGHYFYQAHKPEMDSLVRELQSKLDLALQQPTMTALQQEKAKKIVETWYEWAQELFCDAIGLEIGGKTFLKAFGYFLRMQGQTALQQSEKDLANSSHPVSWLRIKFLVERARALGLVKEAGEIEKEWSDIAATLKISEDYYGYYAVKYHDAIREMIDNMVIEAGPISFSDYLSDNPLVEPSYIQIIHNAWELFEAEPDNYDIWEQQKIRELLNK
jgi:hypothetical protein